MNMELLLSLGRALRHRHSPSFFDLVPHDGMTVARVVKGDDPGQNSHGQQ